MEIYNGTYTIYCHENKINGKKYIGITKNSIKKRWGKKGQGYSKSTPYIRNAFKKYGWDNFYHIIIASNLTKEEACNFEKILINKLDTMNPQKGYNIASGGNDGNNQKRTPEQRKNISEAIKKAHKEKPEAWENLPPVSEKTRKKMSESAIGKVLSEKTKDKIRDFQTGRKRDRKSVKIGAEKRSGSKHFGAKSIIQYTLDGTIVKKWDCVKIASKETNINYSTILACAHFRVKYAGNYIWRYEDIKEELK